MTEIQQKIADYIGDKSGASDFDLLCFVGMLETGEATTGDFRAVGGELLALAVVNRSLQLDTERAGLTPRPSAPLRLTNPRK